MKTAWWIGLVVLAVGCGAPAEDDGLVDESAEAVAVREGDYDLASAAGSGPGAAVRSQRSSQSPAAP